MHRKNQSVRGRKRAGSQRAEYTAAIVRIILMMKLIGKVCRPDAARFVYLILATVLYLHESLLFRIYTTALTLEPKPLKPKISAGYFLVHLKPSLRRTSNVQSTEFVHVLP